MFCELLVGEKAAVVLPGAVAEPAVTGGANVKLRVTDGTRRVSSAHLASYRWYQDGVLRQLVTLGLLIGKHVLLSFLDHRFSTLCIKHMAVIYIFLVAHSSSPGS
jgi:hypothetical protein